MNSSSRLIESLQWSVIALGRLLVAANANVTRPREEERRRGDARDKQQTGKQEGQQQSRGRVDLPPVDDTMERVRAVLAQCIQRESKLALTNTEWKGFDCRKRTAVAIVFIQEQRGTDKLHCQMDHQIDLQWFAVASTFSFSLKAPETDSLSR